MGHCKECRHWDQGDPTWDWGHCVVADGLEGEAQYSDSLAYAQDVEFWGAWLKAHASFGCVQWAAKKVKEGEDV